MYIFFCIMIGLLIFEGTTCYVLLQKNQSNDAMFHKAGSERHEKFPKRRAGDDTNSLESVILAIDTGVKQFMASKNKPDIVDNIAKSLVEFAKSSADPIYRAKGQEYDIKPELIHFRSDKPSVMFEINSKSIINVLRDLLQSKTVHKYMEKFSKEAAIIYRAVKQHIEKMDTKQHN